MRLKASSDTNVIKRITRVFYEDYQSKLDQLTESMQIDPSQFVSHNDYFLHLFRALFGFGGKIETLSSINLRHSKKGLKVVLNEQKHRPISIRPCDTFVHVVEARARFTRSLKTFTEEIHEEILNRIANVLWKPSIINQETAKRLLNDKLDGKFQCALSGVDYSRLLPFVIFLAPSLVTLQHGGKFLLTHSGVLVINEDGFQFFTWDKSKYVQAELPIGQKPFDESEMVSAGRQVLNDILIKSFYWWSRGLKECPFIFLQQLLEKPIVPIKITRSGGIEIMDQEIGYELIRFFLEYPIFLYCKKQIEFSVDTIKFNFSQYNSFAQAQRPFVYHRVWVVHKRNILKQLDDLKRFSKTYLLLNETLVDLLRKYGPQAYPLLALDLVLQWLEASDAYIKKVSGQFSASPLLLSNERNTRPNAIVETLNKIFIVNDRLRNDSTLELRDFLVEIPELIFDGNI
ncbi:MAG: hypothetical protein NZT61_05340 [Deltaproteobacteria bacterium]|nr:hypothetical protein [Deltaproteobacteria bacterium]